MTTLCASGTREPGATGLLVAPEEMTDLAPHGRRDDSLNLLPSLGMATRRASEFEINVHDEKHPTNRVPED